jgi:glycosyltransferase involved in cell wall biosynthesis
LAENRGLGAAVRVGFEHALVTFDPVAVAFADADGEYAPEELERLIAPIVAGDADYVIGSRFRGEIKQMLRARRFGNRALTISLRVLAGVPLTDGQSGFRALSASAAARAEIIHDYNYAQVLTLDLLAKGFRYAEVPISYSFRTGGTSFVRPLAYLRNVVPAVARQLGNRRTQFVRSSILMRLSR